MFAPECLARQGWEEVVQWQTHSMHLCSIARPHEFLDHDLGQPVCLKVLGLPEGAGPVCLKVQGSYSSEGAG